jgi:hypothetical protein
MPALVPHRVPETYRRPDLDNVNEVEFDLILTMALYTSPAFGSFIFERAFQRKGDLKLIGVWRGKWGPAGEATRVSQRDVSVLADFGNQADCLLLIENKFLKAFQPDQAEKYREFGEEGVTKGWWSSYRTCLCGPSDWINTFSDSSAWPCRLTFDEVSGWFERHSSIEQLAPFVAAMIKQAANSARRKGK